ncbi:hypothetical protein [Runella zeae]|uniref:hypothetical protein n=1 Tax=Runella zeae TaxID=94255 RepID=UPI00235276A8|nr:hypothetical protein [Runella zeae]
MANAKPADEVKNIEGGDEMSKIIAEQAATITAKDAEIKALKDEISRKDALVSTLQVNISKNDEIISNLQLESEEKDVLIAELEAEVKKHDNQGLVINEYPTVKYNGETYEIKARRFRLKVDGKQYKEYTLKDLEDQTLVARLIESGAGYIQKKAQA